MVLLSQFIWHYKVVTNETKEQHIAQVKVELHDSQIVFDFSDDRDDDDVMVLPYLVVLANPKNCNVVSIWTTLIQKGQH